MIYNLGVAEWGIVINSILAVLTFCAVLVSMWTVIINSYPKGKMFLIEDETQVFPTYALKLYNKRVVPINIIQRGFYLKKKNSISIIRQNDKRVKIEMSDALYFKVQIAELNQILIEMDYKPGDELVLYGFFQCANGKRYEKHTKHVVVTPGIKISTKLQTSR
ncbi:hypothetical protein [Lysinibacillus sp. NPDC093216]|uniref:hypothetical protein n=1 Tax=Lysinibacillus sp. NPDC093216 TaxID=3390576 RepID=UPI003D0602F2